MMRTLFILLIISITFPGLSGQNEQLIINPPATGAGERFLTFENPRGSIKVIGYDGELIVVTGTLRHPEPEKKTTDGLRRIEQNTMDIRAEVNGQNVLLLCRSTGKTVDFDIKIPAEFSLKLKSLDNGNVEVLNIDGVIEVSNNNGNITLENIFGAAILSSAYGDISASFREVRTGAPMMFTSFEGNVFLTLPASVNVNLKMKSDKGEILSDFEILPGKRQPVVRQVDNTAVYSLEDWTTGSVNKGGPELVLQSYSGKIILKKK